MPASGPPGRPAARAGGLRLGVLLLACWLGWGVRDAAACNGTPSANCPYGFRVTYVTPRYGSYRGGTLVTLLGQGLLEVKELGTLGSNQPRRRDAGRTGDDLSYVSGGHLGK